METDISQLLSSIDNAETITQAHYCLIIKTEWRIYAPVKQTVIDSGNGLLPVLSLFKPLMAYFPLYHKGTYFPISSVLDNLRKVVT